MSGNDQLPELEPIPLYLLSQGDDAGTAIRQFEELILAELETYSAPPSPVPV